MTSYANITDELLSAYLDNMVTDQERALIEEAAAHDPDVAWRLSSLRYTVDLLRQLPEIAPPRTFTLTELQAAGILDDQLTVPVSAADSGPGRLDRIRAIFSAGNPVWRNAAAACAALLLVVVISDRVRPAPGMPTDDASTATVLTTAAPADPTVDPPGEPAIQPAMSALTVSEDESQAAAADITSASRDAGTEDDADVTGAQGDALAVAPPPSTDAGRTSPRAEADVTSDADFDTDAPGADVGGTEVGDAEMAVVAAAAQEPTPMPVDAAEGAIAAAAAPQADGDDGAMTQSMSPVEPDGADEMPARMAPPPAPEAAAVASLSARSITSAPGISATVTAPTIIVTDVITSAEAVMPAAVESPLGATSSGELNDVPVQTSSDMATEPLTTTLAAGATRVDTQPGDSAPEMPASDGSADLVGAEESNTEESVSAAMRTGNANQTDRMADMLAVAQLALAGLALLFAFLWVLSIRRALRNPSRSVDHQHQS